MNRDKIINYYHQYLDEILKVYIQHYAKVRWLTPSDLVLKHTERRISWGDKLTDRYIYEAREDKTLLGRDILEHGTYFPVFVTEDNVVMMGVHRAESLKLLNSDRRLMCVVLCPHHFDHSRTDKPKYEFRNPVQLRCPVEMRAPACAEIPKDHRMDEYILFKVNRKAFLTEEDYVTLKVSNYRDLMDMLKLTPHWIKDQFYLHQTLGERIPSADYINDEGAYRHWITSANTKNTSDSFIR